MRPQRVLLPLKKTTSLQVLTRAVVLLFLLLSNSVDSLHAQCPSVDTLHFHNQAELDSFAVEYPDCTYFSGSISIDDTDISNLGGLGLLDSIGGDFQIIRNDSLLNLEGLDSLKRIGGRFLVFENDMLTSFEGLYALSIIGDFIVGDFEAKFDADDNIHRGNHQLLNFQGLQSLHTIEGDFSVKANPSLVNFEGLSNLQSIGSTFNVIVNNSLVDFTGLESLDSISGDFYLSFIRCHEYDTGWYINENLSSFTGLSSLQSISGSFVMYAYESLVNFSGLENLQSIGQSFVLGRLYCSFDSGDGNSYKGNPNLVNFEGLENLEEVRGAFRLYGNNDLLSFQGLNNLASIGSFTLRANSYLLNFEGLENLVSIGEGFHIGRYDSYDDECVGNSSLNSFQGLSSLQTIGHNLSVACNNSLGNFSGLENLQSIGGSLIVEESNSLINFLGLDNVQFISSTIIIENNKRLTNFIGLQDIDSIGGTLQIRSNDSLINFHGLENLQTIEGGLVLSSNNQLETLSGLNIQNTSSISGLWIYDNDSLSLCSEPFICNYLSNLGYYSIYNNAEGCNSREEIMSHCIYYGQLIHPVFYDLDENGAWSNDEPFLSSASIHIAPIDQISYGNEQNGGLVYLPYDEYDISLNDDILNNWELTTTDTTATLLLDSLHNRDTIYWGLRPLSFETDISTGVVNGLARCNEFVTFEVMAINQGTTTADGTLWFDIDPEVLAINYIDTPDTIAGNWRVGWHFQQLYPDQVVKKIISLQLPGPPDFPIGDFLNFDTQTNFEDENGFHNNAFNTHQVEVQCSYDPNDKLVSPQYPENYALINENLIYTIRFQNTGNAEAYDVVITDELDPHLDLSTFQYITSSHESVLSTYLEGNTLTFEFRDIFLPDSTTNFDASQGYVMYSIRANDTIAENTNINNTANIFFDYNPAVVTNTTENTMLSTFDFDGDGFMLWEDCDDNNVFVNASVVEIPYNGLDDDCNEMTLDDDLDQDGFLLADDCDDNNALVNPSIVEIPYNGLDDDCNEMTLDDDLDQDGFLLADDCDDNNALVNSDAPEIPYNGLDDDCDEATLDDDLDQDGFLLADDCDDENPAINTSAEEIPNNGIDEDCDGEDLMVSAKEIITIEPQIFPNPTSGILQVTFPEEVEGTFELKNLNGQLIFQNTLKKNLSINLATQPQGVYLLLLKTKEKVWVEQVVKY